MEALKRKERTEAHLYMNVNMVTEDLFCSHQGNDLFDPDKALYRLVQCFPNFFHHDPLFRTFLFATHPSKALLKIHTNREI